MNPISVAFEGKGPSHAARRAVNILGNYGVTPAKMGRALQQFAAILGQFGCRATFPITATVLRRNPDVVEEYQALGLEFAIHGYRHLDHFRLSRTEQLAQLELARQLFDEVGVQAKGFRAPYLHANADTLAALQDQHLSYDSSQGLNWLVPNARATPSYGHLLRFYGALSASAYPSLPSLQGNLTCIPYSLPDDEALANHLSLQKTDQMSEIWLAVLRRSHQLGELFTLGLHPERMLICQEPLTVVLSEARKLYPPVWIARLDEIADWWRARSAAEVRISDTAGGRLRVSVAGPSGTTVLVRGVEVDAATQAWADGYREVQGTTFTVRSPRRPFIGVSPTVSPELSTFVRQQGYIVETSQHGDRYAHCLQQTRFHAQDQRTLLAQIEGTSFPLVRLGRWPHGAHSALAITGDIDALTLWDYGLRFLGR